MVYWRLSVNFSLHTSCWYVLLILKGLVFGGAGGTDGASRVDISLVGMFSWILGSVLGRFLSKMVVVFAFLAEVLGIGIDRLLNLNQYRYRYRLS